MMTACGARSMRRRGSSTEGMKLPLGQPRDLEFHVASLGGSQLRPVPVAVIHPDFAALIASIADRLLYAPRPCRLGASCHQTPLQASRRQRFYGRWFTMRSRDLAKTAAVAHAMCDRDDVPPPRMPLSFAMQRGNGQHHGPTYRSRRSSTEPTGGS